MGVCQYFCDKSNNSILVLTYHKGISKLYFALRGARCSPCISADVPSALPIFFMLLFLLQLPRSGMKNYSSDHHKRIFICGLELLLYLAEKEKIMFMILFLNQLHFYLHHFMKYPSYVTSKFLTKY